MPIANWIICFQAAQTARQQQQQQQLRSAVALASGGGDGINFICNGLPFNAEIEPTTKTKTKTKKD